MFWQQQSSARRAFTLVEMLVVIAILAILAALLAPMGFRMLGSAATTKTVANLKAIQSVSFTYASDHDGHYLPIRIDVQTWPQGGPSALPNALNRWMTHPKVLGYFGIDTNEMVSGQPRHWMPVAKSGKKVRVLNGGTLYTDGRQTVGINKTDLFGPGPLGYGNPSKLGFRMTEIKNPNRMIAFAESTDWMVAHTENGVNLINHWEERFDQGDPNPRVAAPAFRNKIGGEDRVCVVTYSGSVQQLTREEANEFDRWSVRAPENQ
jgi:prepilin-type N-terminal cleavage/methylation domain-containing protein